MIARLSPAARRRPFVRDTLALLAGVALGAGLLAGIVHAERPAGCHRCASHGITAR